MNTKPLILVTNDDGFDAKGIKELVDSLNGLGEIIVVAPDGPRSGQSGAITPHLPMRIHNISRSEYFSVFKTNGTPVDCIKLAMYEICERKPDLIVSGINHGSNAAVSILYSGTMGAVLEGCVLGIPSVGFSLCSYERDPDFTVSKKYVRTIVENIINTGLADGVCLNVNIPYMNEVKGMKICRQANGFWTQEYVKKTDPFGHDYYWLTGSFCNQEPDNPETDEWVLSQGFVSVVPCKIDMTAHDYLTEFAHLEDI